ncbi:hypothetical protein [Cylindrospermopsis raciborskii]|uniref:hypothetical protein n=1 Tax=Cylindrospermopsis raciborskii TaxID=77022 RepID=UPI0011AF55DD|nr:hypothetical protein [Cylindrospermopsis raciborskii]
MRRLERVTDGDYGVRSPVRGVMRSPSKYPQPLEITDSSFDGKRLPSMFSRTGTESEMHLDESDRPSIRSDFPLRRNQGIITKSDRP